MPANNPDYFALLNVPRSLDMDLALLNRNYVKLQQEFHPDKNKDSAAKSGEINQAYSILKNKFKRLQYLVELSDIKDLKASQELLMEVMELQESFTPAAAPKIQAEIDQLFEQAALAFKAGKIEDVAAKFIKIKYLNNVIANT